MEIRMSNENQEIILDILIGLGLEFNEDYDDTNRPRFQIIVDGLPQNVFVNIPKNEGFIFQLIFENGSQDVQLRDRLANQLGYPVGGGIGSGGYLTIYLPNRVHIEIVQLNKELIKHIIQDQIEGVLGVIN